MLRMYKLLREHSQKNYFLKREKRVSENCFADVRYLGNYLALVQALVSLSQRRAGRVWLEGSRVEKYGQTDTSLGLWGECEEVGDHLTAYDGPGVPSGSPPVPLVRLCRGGPVPEIVSSGPDLLLVFRNSRL